MWYLTPGTLNTCLISSTGEPKEKDTTTTAVSHRTRLQQLRVPNQYSNLPSYQAAHTY